jgi:thioredoxin reductase (NADPH)
MPRRTRVEALIVGAGPAGLSAALFLRDFGVEYLLVEERLQPGGQLHEIHASMENYLLGIGWQGDRFAAGFLSEARAAGLSIQVGSPVARIAPRMRVVEGSDQSYQAKALLIATGLRRRALGVPGEKELLGRGVSHSANRDRTAYAGRPVVVVGGGTAGVEDALLCAEVGSQVTLLHHSSRFRARPDFLERAKKDPSILIVQNARVTRIVGDGRVEAVEYRVPGVKRTRVVKAEAIFIRIGWEPRTELLRGKLRLDRAGYIQAGVAGVTSVPGVYAVGDVCSPRWPSVANAVGQGAAAGWEIARKLGKAAGKAG